MSAAAPTSTRCCRRFAWRSTCWPVVVRVACECRRRAPCSSAAERRRCCRLSTCGSSSTRSATGSAWLPDAEITTEANPESVTPAYFDKLREAGIHPHLDRHAVGGAARAGGARPPAPAGPAGAGGRRGSRGRLRAHQPRPDLRRAVRDRRRLAGVPGRRRSPTGRTTSAPTRWSSRRAPRWPARWRRAWSRRRTTTCWPIATSWPTRRCARPASSGTRCRTGPVATPARCRHNELYWTDANWWGLGPGAHSHVGGVRWWNVKHPRATPALLDAGHSPAAGRETLDEAARLTERVMLRYPDARRPAV